MRKVSRLSPIPVATLVAAFALVVWALASPAGAQPPPWMQGGPDGPPPWMQGGPGGAPPWMQGGGGDPQMQGGRSRRGDSQSGENPFGGGRSRRTRSPEEEAQRQQRFTSMVQELDANHNGTLDPDEVSGPRQFMISGLLRRAGIEPEFPMPVSRILDAIKQQSAASGRGAPPASNANSASSSGTASNNPAADTPPGTSLVPGFGSVSMTLSGANGFGSAAPASATATSPTSASSASANIAATSSISSSSSNSASGSSNSTSSNANTDKFRNFAKSMIRQYDGGEGGNNNGVLEPEEWSQMKNNPAKADRDGDGQITLDELAAWLMDPSGTSSGGTGGDTQGNGRIRFLTAQERLPSGLPSWFKSDDADKDGQVAMYEFTKDWSQKKVDEFTRYDLNGDGFITPDEYLDASASGRR